jgi:hypothetical protein
MTSPCGLRYYQHKEMAAQIAIANGKCAQGSLQKDLQAVKREARNQGRSMELTLGTETQG